MTLTLFGPASSFILWACGSLWCLMLNSPIISGHLCAYVTFFLIVNSNMWPELIPKSCCILNSMSIEALCSILFYSVLFCCTLFMFLTGKQKSLEELCDALKSIWWKIVEQNNKKVSENTNNLRISSSVAHNIIKSLSTGDKVENKYWILNKALRQHSVTFRHDFWGRNEHLGQCKRTQLVPASTNPSKNSNIW